MGTLKVRWFPVPHKKNTLRLNKKFAEESVHVRRTVLHRETGLSSAAVTLSLPGRLYTGNRAEFDSTGENIR